MQLSNQTLLFVWLALAACIITYLAFVGFLFSYLRKQHNDVWVKLGSPSLFVRNTLYSNAKFFEFFLLRRYKSMRDPQIDGLFRVIWPAFASSTLIMLLLIAGLWSRTILLPAP
jgi:hypothetical protein